MNKNAHAPLVSRALEAAQGDRTVATPRIGDGLLFAGDRPLRRLPLPARTDKVEGRNGDRLGLYRCRVRHAAGTCPAPATIMARILDPYVEQVLPRRAEPDALTTQQYVMDQHLVEVVPRKGG